MTHTGSEFCSFVWNLIQFHHIIAYPADNFLLQEETLSNLSKIYNNQTT